MQIAQGSCFQLLHAFWHLSIVRMVFCSFWHRAAFWPCSIQFESHLLMARTLAITMELQPFYAH